MTAANWSNVISVKITSHLQQSSVRRRPGAAADADFRTRGRRHGQNGAQGMNQQRGMVLASSLLLLLVVDDSRGEHVPQRGQRREDRGATSARSSERCTRPKALSKYAEWWLSTSRVSAPVACNSLLDANIVQGQVVLPGSAHRRRQRYRRAVANRRRRRRRELYTSGHERHDRERRGHVLRAAALLHRRCRQVGDRAGERSTESMRPALAVRTAAVAVVESTFSLLLELVVSGVIMNTKLSVVAAIAVLIAAFSGRERSSARVQRRLHGG